MAYILVIDEGTSHTRAILFNIQGEIERIADEALTQYYPHPGWVEHCPEEIWKKTLMVIRRVCEGVDIADIVSCGITNQRETTVLWDKQTGRCIGRAIVWQDRRTQAMCDGIKDLEGEVYQRTGLKVDPYFSASKLAWMIEHYQLRDFTHLAFGTIDSFLLWRLTEGLVHATDITNASRTLLMNIHTQSWDEELLNLFSIPKEILPDILDCDAYFGDLSSSILGRHIPIRGVIGDQQASLVGVGALVSGMAKVTYGTGGFLMSNTGQSAHLADQGLLTTIAYRLQGQTHYALEGNIYDAGSSLNWMKNQLNWITNFDDIEPLVRSVDCSDDVYFIPSFSGLGAPYWLTECGASFVGISRSTTKAHLVRAVLESIAFQTRDILNVMAFDGLQSLSVDGGMVHNQWFVNYLAHLIQIDIDIPHTFENTAKGVVWIAGTACGHVGDITEWQQHHKLHCPTVDDRIQRSYLGWLDVLNKARKL
ncbi:MAG: glycerol kinase [Pseudomonadota bacterium]|nr:glycerol kinase [Pseudomonadota bacterium]